MKPAQWTAVLVLVLMVGGISFITVYLGGGNRGAGVSPAETLASLTFPVKIFPREGEAVQTTEVGQRGHQDFWFANETGRDVAVGLNRKGCTCSEVEITRAPARWRPYLVRLAVASVLEGRQRNLANLTTLAAAWNREGQALESLESEETSMMLTLENSATVPAGAIGRVRLSWRQEQKKHLNTYADLWMDQRGSSANAHLEVNVLITPPMDVSSKEITISAIDERDLEKKEAGLRSSIVCFSMTRPVFDVKAKLLHDYIKPESDPVELGDPIPLTGDQLPHMGNESARSVPTVLSGYRIPVTVRSRAKDGTPIEWGHYRRVVQLSSSDASIEPIQVTLTGQVHGDITIGEGRGAGMINLGPFPRLRGKQGSILLQSDEKEIKLELDTSRKPEYLNATLEPKETGSAHRNWVLHVEARPGEVWGEFPNPNNPVYRDSAIYVTTRVGKNQTPHRSIRIPVLGVAN